MSTNQEKSAFELAMERARAIEQGIEVEDLDLNDAQDGLDIEDEVENEPSRLEAIMDLLDDEDADYLMKVLGVREPDVAVAKTPAKATKKARKATPKAEKSAPKSPGLRVPKDRILDKMPAVKDQIGARVTILPDNQVEAIWFTRHSDGVHRMRHVAVVSPSRADEIVKELDKRFANSNSKTTKSGNAVTNWWL